MRIDGTVVRTAASRLASDDWLERHRVGRNSYYRLSKQGRIEFEHAAARVYAGAAEPWSGGLLMAVVKPDADKDAARAALKAGGFAAITPDLWAAAASTGVSLPAGIITFKATAETDDLIALAKMSWPLDALAESYRRFLDAFDSLRDSLTDPKALQALEPLDAFVARTLLVHEYRRIILRDPLLPEALLPPNWPGWRARQLCTRLYPALLPASERWLSDRARCEDGMLPSAQDDIRHRFQDRANDI